MPQVQELHAAFYELGVRLGHQLAARLLAGEPAAPAVAAGPFDAALEASRPPPSKPRILPGLSGRRRRPGEQPPLCGRPGCGKPSRTRGYCQTHYVQWLKAGADRGVG
jgi:hypothetical protein